MSITQYLRDTQGELRHVAWPTRLQTIVYTILVALLSVGIALYLGLFDFLFTTGLARFLEVLPSVTPVATTQDLGSSSPVVLDSVSTTTVPTSTSPATPSLEDALKVK